MVFRDILTRRILIVGRILVTVVVILLFGRIQSRSFGGIRTILSGSFITTIEPAAIASVLEFAVFLTSVLVSVVTAIKKCRTTRRTAARTVRGTDRAPAATVAALWLAVLAVCMAGIISAWLLRASLRAP